ncbi:Uncharacterized protein OBRU01_09221 [Operophtera brumata]|uniref:Endonuclease/exonuclease/phosphatase domain-containing protein n=1 Tax=Operophtera brumata TaxID=104452 RepID=A0A0L7LCM3_OPEBR|nr:Uncharacterized protein OBRU01_09221 [Operophtera brumata]
MIDKFLKVGLYNPGSLGTNHDDFIVALVMRSPDIMAINETWIKDGEEWRAPIVPGYKLRYSPRPIHLCGGRGGGVGFYIKCGIKARVWTHPVDPQNRSVEQMWLTLTVNGKKLAIGTAYRPERTKVDTFFDAVTASINAVPNCDNVLLLGDMNINLLVHDNGNARKLHNFLNCLNLKQLVSDPTHFTENQQTLIDLVCTDLRARNVIVEPIGKLYGHAFITCELNIKREKIEPQRISYRPLKSILPHAFSEDLNCIRWDLCMKIDKFERTLPDGSRHHQQGDE